MLEVVALGFFIGSIDSVVWWVWGRDPFLTAVLAGVSILFLVIVNVVHALHYLDESSETPAYSLQTHLIRISFVYLSMVFVGIAVWAGPHLVNADYDSHHLM